MIPEADVYWAVILQHRWWHWFDRSELYLMGQRDGKLDGHAVRRIAAAYSVARGLRLKLRAWPRLKDEGLEQLKTLRAQGIADLLNGTIHRLGNSLGKRESRCRALARVAKRYGLTHDIQVSAMTKLTWFLGPQGWTVFDDRAATGLGIHVTTAAKGARSKRFYAELEGVGFANRAGQVRLALADAGLQELPPERVLDSYLMLRKGLQRDRDIEFAAAYLDSLEPAVRRPLRSAANGVLDAIGSDPFNLGAV